MLPEEYPTEFQEAIQQQNQKGWDQWFRGRVALGWEVHFINEKATESKKNNLSIIMHHTAEQWKDLWTNTI